VRLTVDSKKIFENIQEFRDRAVEGITLDRLLTKIYKNPLMELYEILIQPVEKEISGKKHLVIVPHGMLHYLPFQALLSKEGKYLIESYTISYLPSASVLKYARWKNKGNRLDLFAVGNPFTELLPLPAAEMEVKEVSAIFEKIAVVFERGYKMKAAFLTAFDHHRTEIVTVKQYSDFYTLGWLKFADKLGG
jgi:CHAT domain-containing protein